MLDLMQQELDFSRGEALTLASLTVDLIRRPAFTYRSSSVPGKREIPIGGAPAEKVRVQRARFVRSTFDWVVCSEPLAGLRRTRNYGDSIADLGCIGNGKVGIPPKITRTPVTGPRIAAAGDPYKRQQRVFLDVVAHLQWACRKPHAMNCRLRSLLRSINDQHQSPFRIHSLFGIETFDDPHGAVAPWTCWTNRLVWGCGRRFQRWIE